MTKTIEAVFENGAFRPTEPVSLSEGERVQITVTQRNAARCDPAVAMARLMAIADKPDSPDDDGLGGDQHDQIIYGNQDDL